MSRLIVIFLTLFTAVSWAEQFSVGVVSDVENEASVVIKGEEKKLSVGMFIEKGSKIVTGKASKVKIMMMDDSLLIIAPGTEFSIDDYAIDTDKKSRKSVLGVIRGKVLFYVNKAFSKQGSKFEVKTRSSIAGVRGTKFFVESTEKEFVGVINGEVELRTQDKEIILSG
ncbi:MAG: FecR family protein, partial [Deltaproteobacteria bacterium]|nr:FecR family protein [Deltaproteobacteria bacterium]